MRRSVRLYDKDTNIENKVQREPKAKKSRLNNEIKIIAAIGNDTMIEVFKSLNYMQLAKSSLVSKQFFSLIRTQRHTLALLFVDSICMGYDNYATADIKIFNKELSPEEYNEWIIRKNYSNQVPSSGKQSKKYGHKVYEMKAYYKDFNKQRTTVFLSSLLNVFNAHAVLQNENWPLFQHFVRLLTDPFIYINYLQLTPRIEVSFLNLLAGAIEPNYNRLQCNTLVLFSNEAIVEDNIKKFISWINNNVLCADFRIYHDCSNFEEELLNLFVTGAYCTSETSISHCDVSNVTVAFLQKFMDLKASNEYQMVESIRCFGANFIEVLKREYAEFVVVEEKDEDSTELFFELINKDIKKKLLITARPMYDESYLLEIKSL